MHFCWLWHWPVQVSIAIRNVVTSADGLTTSKSKAYDLNAIWNLNVPNMVTFFDASAVWIHGAGNHAPGLSAELSEGLLSTISLLKSPIPLLLKLGGP